MKKMGKQIREVLENKKRK